MKIIRLLLIILIIVFSCSTEQKPDVYKQIKSLEFSRSVDTSAFARILSQANEEEIVYTVESIAKIGHETFLPILKNLLYSKSDLIKSKVIFALGQIGTPACEDLLIEIFKKQKFNPFKKDIIYALGICSDIKGSELLVHNLDSFNDTLKAAAIQNLAFIFKRIKKPAFIPDTVKSLLDDLSTLVRSAAAYFFHRNEYKPALFNVLNFKVSKTATAYKYKLSALSKILEKQLPDSMVLDSIKTVLINNKFYKETDWKKLVYKIKILSVYPDSLTTEKIASYLNNKNPHVRVAAINALGKFGSEQSKNALLYFYDKTNWNEKGLIIYNLADQHPKFIYRLIQQNLDQGTLYFKELLLQSLAKIKDKMSLSQLKQFLNVPSPRLQAVAFSELDKLYKLSYRDVKPFLLSGDIMLASYALDWLKQRPKYFDLNDLISAYQKFSEPKDLEVLVDLLEQINNLKSESSIAFLDTIYQQTTSSNIARLAKKGLAQFGKNVPEKTIENNSLFIPDSIIFNSDPILITIKTEKGDIQIELWPDQAPLTVSNFLYLINKGFYKNCLFHRVVSDFVVQAGDPTGTGWGGPGYSIPCEYNDKPYLRGSVGMATAGKDTGGSQFFICHSEQPHLNRRYTNFGIVKEGMDVVDQITKDDKILNIKINSQEN